jgi:hypothetical protein
VSAGILSANYYQFWERRHPAGKLLSILGAPASCRQITINFGSAGILPANYYQ